ncbi:hypothetical protein KKG71_03440 [Patescibacteria group bacterium]|nr:hypothetical protein [Patescibacteria group bacterium]
MTKKIVAAVMIVSLLLLSGCNIPFVKNGNSVAIVEEPSDLPAPTLSPQISPPSEAPSVEGPGGQLPPTN